MREARDGARQVKNSIPLDIGARAGFAASGLLHLLIGYLAVEVAFHRTTTAPDQSGALGTLAQHTAGKALLIVFVIGFAALALWQLSLAVVGEGRDRGVLDRFKHVALAVVYLAIAWSALSFVRNKGRSSAARSTDVTASIMQHPGGRWLVALVGLIIIGIGGFHLYKGVRAQFLQDLREHPGRALTWIGRVGYVAKGLALGIVGVLFVVAAAQHHPSDASGLDGALSVLRRAIAGQLLLTLMGVGLATFGVYALARARFARV